MGSEMCIRDSYQPYRVRDKAYTKKEEIIAEARKTREHELMVVLAEIQPLIEAGESVLLCEISMSHRT